MRNQIILLSLSTALTASACNQVECAEGTIERDGKCSPADEGPIAPATCGAFTRLVGTECVPMFPPTQCDPATTEPDVDENGVTTCHGTSMGTCGTPLACPVPTGASKQTICGQLYDIETMMPYAAAGAGGTRCDANAPASSGPCALTILAVDAQGFAAGNTTPLGVGDLYIDDCGRYRLTNVETSTVSLYIGLGIDDAGAFGQPGGMVVTSAVATPKAPMTAVKDLEAFVVKPATVGSWVQSSGGALPALSATVGYYMPIYRAHKVPGTAPYPPQAGVMFAKNGSNTGFTDFYFASAQTTHQTIDAAASMTGANGTTIITNASLNDSVSYDGIGGITNTAACRWAKHAGASVPGIVFVQTFYKADITGQTCND